MSAPTNTNRSLLDQTQIFQRAFDEATDRVRVDADITIDDATIVVETSYQTDSMAIGDPVTNNILKINSDGSIDANISGSTTVTGNVTTTEAGLGTFQTSQYPIGTSTVQLAPTSLPNRSSLSLRVTATGTNAVYIGNSSSVTTSNGYPLYNGDTLQMDLTPTGLIYAISNAVGQTVAVLEIG